ncbi:endonuclease MutS2 [Fuchsiella alkaliacetigena]|uniref:endonuclease MutS2 n=1 Tax=Fuchsiella alkaliacetigena TaxID=957042 RepID=UPI00200A2950|nr:endonuclease MutS2 [Fuchsiella alkaliacetigena]MCK8825991.1 endonuclease MutS2 [Fuchsiella alkaliacetigena]
MNQHTLEILEYQKIKERLSKHTTSKLGQKLVEKLKPVTDLDYIQQRQLEATAAKKILIREDAVPLGGIRDIREALKKSNKEITLSAKELLNIANTLQSGYRLRNYFLDLEEEDEEEEYQAVIKHAVQIGDFEPLVKQIKRCIDQQGEVMDRASNKLRSLRRQISSYKEQIKSKLNSILASNKYEKFIQESLVTIRDNRYVIPIKSQYQNDFPGILHDRSASKQTVFIEPMEVVKLNNKLRGLIAEEEDEVYRILTELTFAVQGELKEIEQTLKLLAFLDFTFAKAKYSQQIEGAEPLLNKEQQLKLLKARHPLIELEEVVPVDVELGRDFSTLVITGPNTGGKTVTLKTVGLLTLMAQSGLHIPALSGSEVAVFDQLYGDIGDEQSIEQSLSTFSSHMTKIIDILENCAENALVLLDEIGAGTDPTEGAALAMAILDNLHQRPGVNTVATTHYGQLKTFAYQREGVENASVEFDVQTLEPTYRLQMGLPGRSNAFEIAARLGFDEEIIAQARSFLDSKEGQVDEIIQSLEENKKSIRDDKESIETKKEEVENLKAEYESKLVEVEKKEKEIKKEAYAEAEQIVAEAKEKVDQVIEELKAEAEVEEATADRAKSKFDSTRHNLSKEREKLEDKIKEQEIQAAPQDLQVGERVRIKNLNKDGKIIELLDNKEEAVVQAGNLKVNVEISRLERVAVEEKEKAKQNKEATVSKLRSQKTRKVSPKLDLRGLRALEAKKKVDKYLDNAALAGLGNAEIIHGKGSGVLREIVQELLAEHPHVNDYRDGQEGEGGLGVTIVDL